MGVGRVVTVKHTFSQEDFDRFAVLSGDDNPIHVDPEFSSRTRFGRTVAHGMLLYSSICMVLGTQFPGPCTIQLEQDLKFTTPTYAGEEVTIRLEVISFQPEERLMELKTQVERPDGSLGLEGRTLVRLPREKPDISRIGT
jgi:acyl dehydratase